MDGPRKQAQKRLAMLKAERASWWPHWREISDNLLPRAGRYFASDRNRGDKRHGNILDNTGTRALRVLSAGMMAGMTSPARPWFRLATSDPDLVKVPAVKQWLADVTHLMLQVFARSNTYRALHSLYEELGAFGTAATVVLDDFETVLHHYPLTAGEYCLAQNMRGEVDSLFREFETTVGAVVAEFGLDACSTTVRRMYDAGNLDAWVPLAHAIEPRRQGDRQGRGPQGMAWKSCYFEAGGDSQTMLREGGFRRFPALAPRWNTIGGDVYGHGPGMDALGDLKQLQHQQLRKGMAIDYQVRPPLQVPSALKSREIDMLPGGINYVDNPAAAAAIRTAYDVNLRLDHLLTDMQDVRQRITAAFSADLFLMLANSQDTRMTATEVAERHEEKLLMLGPVLERLHTELLDPLIEMTFDRLLEADVLPPPPPELQGMALNVEFVSMLAQAQRAIGINGMDRFVVALGTVAQMKPDSLDKLDADAWLDDYADRLGLEPGVLVGGRRLAMIRESRAQAQAQAAQAAQAEQTAAAAQKLGTVQTGAGASNAANDVINMFSGYTGPRGEAA